MLKFRFSEKATKIWKNLPLVLTLLSKNSCFVKTGGRFFQILWPSHNILTLRKKDYEYSNELMNNLVPQEINIKIKQFRQFFQLLEAKFSYLLRTFKQGIQ